MHHTNNYNTMYPDFVPPVPLPRPLAAAPILSSKERKAAARGAKKGRRRDTAVWVAVALSLLLVGGTVISVFAFLYSSVPTLNLRPLEPFGWEEPYDDYYGDYYDDYDDYESTADTTIARAPTADGVSLELHAPKAEALSFQQVYKKCIPSIVSVLTTADDGGGSGTGVVLTADGYIITNYHVIQGGTSVEVLLHSGKGYNAKLVGGDQTNDLAVLKIEAKGLTPAEFGNSETLQVGDLAFAIGNPLGEELRGTMTEGIISAIDRDVLMDGNVMNLIQTSAALNSGNSGGALINAFGQVVGITNMKMMSYFDTIEGLGFAIPTATAKTVVEELVSKGHVGGRPTLGFTGYSLTAEDAEEMDLVPGVYVSSVEPKSDAHKQGLQAGDVITECEGKGISSVEDVNDIKADFKPGDALSFEVYREGDYLELEIRLMERYQMDY